MKSNSRYPYCVALNRYIGFSIKVHLDNKTYIGTLDWCSNSCICISNVRNHLFQWSRIQGQVIIAVNRIKEGIIYCSVNGEPKSIAFI